MRKFLLFLTLIICQTSYFSQEKDIVPTNIENQQTIKKLYFRSCSDLHKQNQTLLSIYTMKSTNNMCLPVAKSPILSVIVEMTSCYDMKIYNGKILT